MATNINDLRSNLGMVDKDPDSTTGFNVGTPRVNGEDNPVMFTVQINHWPFTQVLPTTSALNSSRRSTGMGHSIRGAPPGPFQSYR